MNRGREVEERGTTSIPASNTDRTAGGTRTARTFGQVSFLGLGLEGGMWTARAF